MIACIIFGSFLMLFAIAVVVKTLVTVKLPPADWEEDDWNDHGWK